VTISYPEGKKGGVTVLLRATVGGKKTRPAGEVGHCREMEKGGGEQRETKLDLSSALLKKGFRVAGGVDGHA